MHAPLLSTKTAQDLDRFSRRPPHALMLLAPNGAGKGSVACYLAARLLGTGDEHLESQAGFRRVAAQPGKVISIEEIREVTHFLLLKAASKANVTRVVLIEHAGDMTVQAQNALLKTIEEPPEGTVIILTAAHELDVLPTIRSRVQTLTLELPDSEELSSYLVTAGYKAAALSRALLMSGGLPGLTCALLNKEEDHPLVAAAARARSLLQKPAFERLLMIDELTKNKQEWLDTLFILQRMAQINLEKPGSGTASVRKWHGILAAAQAAYQQTLASAQIKLVALNLIMRV